MRATDEFETGRVADHRKFAILAESVEIMTNADKHAPDPPDTSDTSDTPDTSDPPDTSDTSDMPDTSDTSDMPDTLDPPDTSDSTRSSGWRRASRFAIVLLLAAAVTAVLVGPTEEWVRQSLDWIRGLGPAGGAAFIAIYIVATVLFIPGSLLTLGAGFLFGLFWGTVVVSIGSTMGALIAFFVGRYLARDAVERRIEKMPKFQALMRALEGDALKVVFLVRLVPLFPFNVLNYAFGLTGISWKKYLFASWLGMLPGTIAYVWAGAAAETFVRAMSVDQAPGLATWVIWGVGGVALVSVVIFVTRRARSELETIVAEHEDEASSGVDA